MVINNHIMSNFSTLDSLLKEQAPDVGKNIMPTVYEYAKGIAEIEGKIVVVSDLAKSTSKIYCGDFAQRIGLGGYSDEESIWEKKIFDRMDHADRERKFIEELRFFHYLRHLSKNRKHYYLLSKLRFRDTDGKFINVEHKMYYVYGSDGTSVLYAVCLYGPLITEFKGKCMIVNSVTGISEELTSSSDKRILTQRENQILNLIDSGLKSEDIASRLSISKHTVSRHRQEILAKLQVKNSIEACRVAKSLHLI